MPTKQSLFLDKPLNTGFLQKYRDFHVPWTIGFVAEKLASRNDGSVLVNQFK